MYRVQVSSSFFSCSRKGENMYRKLLLSLLAVVVVTSGTVSLACAATARTYRFVEDGQRSFSYSGGLSGYGFESALLGTLEITFNDDQSAFISEFDVKIGDAVVTGDLPWLGLPTGNDLTDYLVHLPVGLPINPVPPTAPVLNSATIFRVEFSDTNHDARLYVSSNRGEVLDAGGANTQSLGLRIELVPEPRALTLAALALLVGIAIRRR